MTESRGARVFHSLPGRPVDLALECNWKVINLINFQYVLETQILRVFACRICIRKIIDAKKSKFCKIRIIGNVMRIVVTLLVA